MKRTCPAEEPKRNGPNIVLQVVAWGTVLICHAAVQNFASLAAVRILLGAFEAAINPGTMLLFSMYYTRSEQPLRMGIWIGSAGVGYIIAGITSFGIGHISTGLSSWRLLFIIWGSITFAWGVFLWFALPGAPMQAKFLTEQQRSRAIARVKDNGTGIENKHFKIKQFWEAMLDLKTWLLFLFALTSNCPNGGLSAVRSSPSKHFGVSYANSTTVSRSDHQGRWFRYPPDYALPDALWSGTASCLCTRLVRRVLRHWTMTFH